MRVKLLEAIAGKDYSGRKGEVIFLTDNEAQALIKANICIEVDSSEPQQPKKGKRPRIHLRNPV